MEKFNKPVTEDSNQVAEISRGEMLLQKLRSRMWIISPTVLVIVALIHPIAVHHFKMNPWKGGAFGMFSSVDHYSNRFLRLTVPTEQGEYPALLTKWKASRIHIICIPNIGLLNEEAAWQDNKKWVLLNTKDLDISKALKSTSSRQEQALVNAYGSSPEPSNRSMNFYDEFLVQSNLVKEFEAHSGVVGKSRLEAFRLVYEGSGQFSSRKLASSENDQAGR